MRSSSRPEASRSATRRASRTGVTTCRVTSQVSPPTSTSSSAPPVTQRPADQREGVLLLGHREEVVERVGAAVGRQRHLRAGHDAGHRARPVDGARSGSWRRCTTCSPRAARLDAGRAAAPGCCRCARRGCCWCRRPRPRRRSEPAIGPVEHDLVALHRPARDQRRDQLGELGAGVEVVAVGGRRAGAAPRRWRGSPRRPSESVLLLDQAVGDLLQQHPADQRDDHGGEQQRADHDPRLDRPAPDGRSPPQRGADRRGAGHGLSCRRSRPCSRRRGR